MYKCTADCCYEINVFTNNHSYIGLLLQLQSAEGKNDRNKSANKSDNNNYY